MDRTTGLVLSGGGAKGSFSAGALDYLFTHQGLRPQVVAGTSAGSICAAVVAQARTADEFAGLGNVLRRTILGLGAPGVAFVPQPWLEGLSGTSLGDDLLELLRGKVRPPIPPDPGLTDDPLESLPESHFTVRHGWDQLRTILGRLAITRHSWQEFKDHDRSVLSIDPLGQALANGSSSGVPAVDVEAVGRPGLRLRLTITALNDGCTRYVTEDGRVVEADATTSAGDAHPGVIEGVLASSSIPLAFEARPIGDDVYVDGGVLQNIPLNAALQLGANEVFVVLAGSTRTPAPTMDYATADMFSVAFRAENTVSFYAQERAALGLPTPAGSSVTVIEPAVTVVSTFETDPHLLGINMDYGWMRACASVPIDGAGASKSAAELADTVVAARVRLAYLTMGLAGQGASVEAAEASSRRLLEASLSDWRVAGLPLPEASASWSGSAESDH